MAHGKEARSSVPLGERPPLSLPPQADTFYITAQMLIKLLNICVCVTLKQGVPLPNSSLIHLGIHAVSGAL